MYKVIILPIAKQDIKQAAHWYNTKQKALGKKFVLQIRQKIDVLKHSLYTIAIRYDDTRAAILDIFPFMVHYTILHTSRNPGIWQNRDMPDNI